MSWTYIQKNDPIMRTHGDTPLKELPTLALFTLQCGCQYQKLLARGKFFRVRRLRSCETATSYCPTLSILRAEDKVDVDMFALALQDSFG